MLLIALTGMSGSGKDTILKDMVRQQPTIHKCILTTTRPIREGELDNIDYHFVSDADFENDNYIYTQCFEVKPGVVWKYGLSKAELEGHEISAAVLTPYALNSGDFGDITVSEWFIGADDKTRLLRQLNREDQPNCYEICRRFISDKKDFEDYYIPLRNFISNDGNKQSYEVARYILDQVRLGLNKSITH